MDEQASELSGFTKLNKNTYYRESPVKDKRRYILCFNPQLFKDQRQARDQAIVDFAIFVQALNAELKVAKGSRHQRKIHATIKKGEAQRFC